MTLRLESREYAFGMSDWTETFFEGLWRQVQLGITALHDNGAIAANLEHVLEIPSGARILDIGCGDGRIAIELADRGYEVTGLDASATFLDAAERRSAERGATVRWIRGDMRELDFEGVFDAAINIGGTFGYFDDDGDRRCAAGAYRSLASGGRLMIDVATTETVFPAFRDEARTETADATATRTNRYDHETGRTESDWTIELRDGRREELHSSMRLYSYREIASLLQDAGFRHMRGYDGASLEPFTLGASRLWLVATK